MYVAIQIAKNCRRRQPHCHLTPPPGPGEPPRISEYAYICGNYRLIGLHFCRW